MTDILAGVRVLTAAAALGGLLGTCATAPGVQRLAPSSLGCMRAVVREKLPGGLPDKQAHCLAADLMGTRCEVRSATTADLAGCCVTELTRRPLPWKPVTLAP